MKTYYVTCWNCGRIFNGFTPTLAQMNKDLHHCLPDPRFPILPMEFDNGKKPVARNDHGFDAMLTLQDKLFLVSMNIMVEGI